MVAKQKFYDGRGRELRDDEVLKDLLGRNRERAMQIMGLEERGPATPSGPRWPLRPIIVDDEHGRHVRLVPSEQADGE